MIPTVTYVGISYCVSASNVFVASPEFYHLLIFSPYVQFKIYVFLLMFPYLVLHGQTHLVILQPIESQLSRVAPIIQLMIGLVRIV